MVASLRAFARRVGGRAFEMWEFNRWPRRRCRAQTIARRFGTWRRALLLVGVEGVKCNLYEAEELMENLERVWRRLGRAPGVRSLRETGAMTHGAYRRRWGSLRRACELLARHKRGEISRADLLKGGIGEYRRALAPSVRWRILERDGRRCVVCGRGAPEVKLEVDHVRPVAAGGGDEEGNLRALCWDCNRGRGKAA
jgi:5-methylcytosine-specific restriction endonuclease McrA